MTPRIKKLLDAVQVMHRCKAEHVQSVPLREMFLNKITWEGVVEVFDITGHPKAKRCYAWVHNALNFETGKDEDQFVTVLEIPPVDSPQTAVRASIAGLLSHLRPAE